MASEGLNRHHDNRYPGVPGEPSVVAATQPSIIGSDDRWQVTNTTAFPFRAITRIEIVTDDGQVEETCSGAFIGPDAVLTAGHCLWDPGTGAWSPHVRVVPALSGNVEPFGSQFATDWWVPDGFLQGGNPDYDWGLVRLPDQRLATQAHWLPVAVLDDATLASPVLLPAIAGYPSDQLDGTMWTASAAALASVQPSELWYAIDTEAGESGAAIWIANPASPRYGQVVGIHTHGASEPAGLNSGSRMSQALLDDLLQACRELICTIDVAGPGQGGNSLAGSVTPFRAIAPVARD